jgi:hypothetical protein
MPFGALLSHSARQLAVGRECISQMPPVDDRSPPPPATSIGSSAAGDRK